MHHAVVVMPISLRLVGIVRVKGGELTVRVYGDVLDLHVFSFYQGWIMAQAATPLWASLEILGPVH